MTVTAQAELTSDHLRALDGYWRAANYLSVGQIYLMSNPLLTEPLRPEHIKPRLLGHWGTTPGLNFIWAHLNRMIVTHDLDMMYVIGPGHGGPAANAGTWLDGSYTEIYPSIGQDTAGMGRLFKQFSFPGGVPSHVAPETPGSIHEGGELGYSLTHAHGAAFDNPDLIVACVVGDGEAETGPLATSWHCGKFLDPARDGAVLPILQLNGWKIANPTVLARIPEAELTGLLRGYGWEPVIVAGSDPDPVHHQLAAALSDAISRIREIQGEARSGSGGPDGKGPGPRWPMIVFRTPKGWTGPATVDGKPVEGTWRAHQVPLPAVRTNPEHLRQLQEWMLSYRPAELFDEAGAPRPEILRFVPSGERRMGSNPHANGGLLLRDLVMPDFRQYAVPATPPGAQVSEPTRVLGGLLRDVMAGNLATSNFRVFGPDETASNRLEAIYQVSQKTWEELTLPVDENLEPAGRVMEILSETTCEGWLEGYLLTGRHGFFSCYEAFIHIVDSMFNQHAKWLKVARTLPWRRPIASLNYLLTSHVWRQDHNGFSHQDPGFIDHVVNKKAEVVRVYLPPDTNTLLSTVDHCLRSRDYVNVIVAGKQPNPDWLDMDAAILHCTRGVGIWEWASNDYDGKQPDVIMACAGDVPTLEILAATSILRENLPDLRIRVVNVVDLMRLEPDTEHPHGMSDHEFNAVFTSDRPVIFAYHGYPALIHRLTYRRDVHHYIHVRGYKEEGTTTTPFDMVVLNDMDRFHLVMDVIDRVPGLGDRAAWLRQQMVDNRTRHHAYVREHGEDLPEVRNWVWPAALSAAPGVSPASPPRTLPEMDVLVVNAGSSSLKLSLLDSSDAILAATEVQHWDTEDPPPALHSFLNALPQVDAVGHRIVHGGPKLTSAAVLDPAVRREIEAVTDLAPLHQPRALKGIDAVSALLPGVPEVACFDTAFHAGMPAAAATYALPAAWRQTYGLRRYGFHGLSHAHATRRAGQLLGTTPERLRIVSCHLGAGASLAAVQYGQSVDTTMGFTPLEGLVMATRAGNTDPGLLVWLLQDGRLSLDELSSGLERRSGLAGLAGAPDIRDVLPRADRGDAAAVLAVDVYLHRLRQLIAGMAAAMDGLDVLVFTGGVGEHQPPIRARAVPGFLGAALDEQLNQTATSDADITAPGAAVRTLVITAREDIEIAHQVRAALS